MRDSASGSGRGCVLLLDEESLFRKSFFLFCIESEEMKRTSIDTSLNVHLWKWNEMGGWFTSRDKVRHFCDKLPLALSPSLSNSRAHSNLLLPYKSNILSPTLIYTETVENSWSDSYIFYWAIFVPSRIRESGRHGGLLSDNVRQNRADESKKRLETKRWWRQTKL